MHDLHNKNWSERKSINQLAREMNKTNNLFAKVEEEKVDSPTHYNKGKYEVIDVIEDWGMDKSFNLGNAIKYIARCESKGDKKNDISKAIWYLQREIANERGNE